MKGCAFHWSQEVLRRVQHEGLADVYRRRGGVSKLIRMLMTLRFLPAPHIRDFETLELMATTDATRRLVVYIRRQWVHGRSFQPRDWSVFR
ncbi:hypothetical protein DPMN_174280 [Dreissena polymorpha]|uniref:Uncharacterized protein n=1 Tax=Dreissena polymorpha TaxID=45954 RepID=A0A9D4E542_DREPO|nr:hypothetical protein DPMN_174280 [Dreissena polymorpha]